MDYLERMPLLDAIDYLDDRLYELFSEEQINSDTLARKRAYRGLVRAVNRADRVLAAVNKRSQVFALFVPKDVKMLPMSKHDAFKSQYDDSISGSDLASAHSTAIEVFLNEEPWHEITAISGIISVYEKNPVVNNEPGLVSGSDVCGTPLRPVDQADLFNEQGGGRYWFDVKNRVLHLSEPLSEDSFLVFEALSVPGLLDMNKYKSVNDRASAEETTLNNYKMDTNLLHERLLEDVALSFLLPTKFEMPSHRAIAAAMDGVESGNGSVVVNVVPEYRY